MARYYFDTYDGDDWELDEMGTDCDDRGSVQALAHAELVDLVRDEVPNGHERLLIVRVRDGDGLLMETSLDLQTNWLR